VRESVSFGRLACDEGIRPLERRALIFPSKQGCQRGMLMIPFAWVSYPDSERGESKFSYVYPECSNHMYSQQ
jgi:hypothetical protein